MRGRRAKAATAPQAIYARVLDGDHVWLAVRRAESLTLTLPDGSSLPVPSEAGIDGDEPVVVVRFDVAAALASNTSPELSLPLLSGGRFAGPVQHAAHRRRGPVLPAPTTRDGRWQFTVGKEKGNVVVNRTAVAPSIAVLGFAVHGTGARVTLATSAPTARLVRDGEVLAELALTDGELLLTDDVATALTGLDLVEPATLEIDGMAAIRPHNLLRTANISVLLPPLPGELELRWVAGSLGIRIRSEDA